MSGEMGVSRATRMILTASAMMAMLMQVLDTTIANVALPYMQGSFAASQREIAWVLTSYIVASAIMTSPVGFLAGRFGRSRLFVGSVIGFTVSSVLCGLAHSLGEIVAFRILQGVFGATLAPLSQAVMFDIYPVERRASAMALWTMGVTIGPIIGPILGGWLTESYSWRWVFYVNVPFGILSAIGLTVFMKDPPRGEPQKLDWIGFGALGLAVGALQLLLDRGQQLDWFGSREIITEACLAGVGFYIFAVQSSLAQKPFLSPKLFADVNFVICIVFIFIVGLFLYATLALMAPYLQTLMGYPVVTAGLMMAPRGGGVMLGSMVCGRALKYTGARPLMGLGFVVSAFSLYLMTQWNTNVSEMAVIEAGVIQGIGVALVVVPLTTVVFSTLPLALRTEASGVFNLFRNTGASIGIAVTGALLERNTQVNHAILAAGATPFNRALQSGAVARFWNPATLPGAAAFDEQVTRQANIIAYIDDFKLMLVLAVMALPLVLLIRSVKTPPVKKEEAAVAVD